MNSTRRQYLLGLIFFGVGIYYITRNVALESLLYVVGGLAFISNALTTEPKLIRYKKPLTILAWILIIATAIFFLYMVQFHWF